MQSFESAATRILAPLSEVLQRPLHLVDSQSAESGHAFAVRLPIPRVSIVAPDGRPFSEVERRLILEMFDVLRLAEESEARYEELEHRMLSLQRENLDLTVKNRLLSEVSSRDSLTGLYNRWFVMEKIETELNRSLRHGSPMSLLMMDLDHFKRINDTLGHLAGDQALRDTAAVLRRTFRESDIVARLGGDEFVALAHVHRDTGVLRERLREHLEALNATRSRPYVLEVSIGTTLVSLTNQDDIETLIAQADAAMYQEKRALTASRDEVVR
jgi:diguanylate cyclase (GGDEF)-like protein